MQDVQRRIRRARIAKQSPAPYSAVPNSTPARCHVFARARRITARKCARSALRSFVALRVGLPPHAPADGRVPRTPSFLTVRSRQPCRDRLRLPAAAAASGPRHCWRRWCKCHVRIAGELRRQMSAGLRSCGSSSARRITRREGAPNPPYAPSQPGQQLGLLRRVLFGRQDAFGVQVGELFQQLQNLARRHRTDTAGSKRR